VLTIAIIIVSLVYMNLEKPETGLVTRQGTKLLQLELRAEGLRILARVIAHCLMKGKAQLGTREDFSGRSTIERPRYEGKRDES
jgi:hypothetical protein